MVILSQLKNKIELSTNSIQKLNKCKEIIRVIVKGLIKNPTIDIKFCFTIIFAFIEEAL